MSRKIYDIDGESDDQVREMTASQVTVFRKNERKAEKEHKASKSKKKSSSNNHKKSKSKKKSSSSSSSQKQKKQKKQPRVKKKLLKKEISNNQTPESKWGQQVTETQLVRYGNSRLVKIGSRSPSYKFSPKAKQTLKSGVTWWISGGDYQQSNWKQIFIYMYEMGARDLRIIQSYYSNIIKEIHHIRMQSLQILYLFENKIKSVELLSRMRLPLLKDLSLRDNLITIIDPLSKMGLENLEILALSGNYILDAECLYLMNSISLKNLYLDWKPSAVMVEDISWLVKLKLHPHKIGLMQSIALQSKHRIAQKKVDEMLSQKFRRPINQLIIRKLK